MIQNKSIPQQRTVRITVKVMKGPHTLKGAESSKKKSKPSITRAALKMSS